MANRAAANSQDELQGLAESLFDNAGAALRPCPAGQVGPR